MDPRTKECFVVLDRIDVAPYRNNSHVWKRNSIVTRRSDKANERNLMPLKHDYPIGGNEVDSEEDAAAEFLLFASFYFLTQNDEKKTENVRRKRKSRSVWVREWTKKRQTEGAYVKLLQELRNGDGGEQRLYREFLRMSHEDFEYILEMVKPLIEKNNTQLRESILAGERLALTLHFLSTGQSFASLQYLFRIPLPTISAIIPKVLDAIWTTLKDEYVR